MLVSGAVMGKEVVIAQPLKNLRVDRGFIITSGSLEKLLAYGRAIDLALRDICPQHKYDGALFMEIGGVLLSRKDFVVEDCRLVPCTSHWSGASYDAKAINETITTAKAQGYMPVGWFHYHPGSSADSCFMSSTDTNDIGIRLNDMFVPINAQWDCECEETTISRAAIGIYSMILTANGAYKTYLSIDDIAAEVLHLEIKPNTLQRPLRFSPSELQKEISSSVTMKFPKLPPIAARDAQTEQVLQEMYAQSPTLWDFLVRNKLTTPEQLRRRFNNGR